MKNMLLLAILLVIFIVYNNINIVEGKRNGRRRSGRRSGRSKKRKPKPFIAWDGDKYKSCEKCCGDDDGCYDSRCHNKCPNGSFRRGDGTLKRRPVKP